MHMHNLFSLHIVFQTFFLLSCNRALFRPILLYDCSVEFNKLKKKNEYSMKKVNSKKDRERKENNVNNIRNLDDLRRQR